MSRKEARRPGLVQVAVAGKITTAEGARALKMSRRQFRRLKARYRAEGVRGLVHRRRGQPSPRQLDVELRDRVAELVQTTYRDFNDCHAHREAPRARGPARQPRAPSAGSGGPWACRPSAAAGRRSTAPAARAAPAWARLVLVDGSQFDWLGTGAPPAPPRRHRRRDEHRRGPALPPRRRPARLSHAARAASPRATGCP